MSILDLYADDVRAARPLVVPTSPQPKTTSIWRDVVGTVTAIPRGVGEASAQVLASGAELVAGIRAFRDASPQQMREMRGGGLPREAFESDLADSLRDRGREFRPDPQTASTAEQVVYGFSRAASKVVAGALTAGPAGVVAAGLEEANTQADELKRQGVDPETRLRAGLVQGAGLAVAALPIAGQTVAGTAALYAAGGPGAFLAQQAATREILQRAGYTDLAGQYDPFDPVGLAVSALVPAPFAALGYRANVRARQVAPATVPDAPAADAAQTAAAVERAAVPEPPPIPQEVVDAARVELIRQTREAANPGSPTDLAALAAHDAALGRAEAALAAGERVEVADAVPVVLPRAEYEANLARFMEGSKVVDEQGRPLVVYHGTSADVSSFDPRRLGEITDAESARGGFFFTSDSRVSSEYAMAFADRPTRTAKEALAIAKASGDQAAIAKAQAEFDAADAAGRKSRIAEGANNIPVYLSMRDPLIVDFSGRSYEEGALQNAIAQAKAEGRDGVIFRNAMDDPSYRFNSDVFVAFSPTQIKSAVGNTGRFDPTSPSLTDSPFADWSQQITTAIRELQASRQIDPPQEAAPAAAQTDATIEAARTAMQDLTDSGKPLAQFLDEGTLPPEVRNLVVGMSERPEQADAILADFGRARQARPAAPAVDVAADVVEAARRGDRLAPEAAPASTAEAAEAQTLAPRIAEVQAQYPDLMVQMDGMDAPVSVADLLRAVQAEADEAVASAPDLMAAAGCAIVNGIR